MRRAIIRGCGLLGLGLAAALGLAAIPASAQFAQSLVTVPNAASANKADDVLAMLLQGKDPNEVDSLGRTALDYAATFDNVPMAQVLLEHRARIDERDSISNTALHWAAGQGKIEMIRFLIANKATVDIQNRQGITPLMLAVGHNEAAAVRLLVANGADPKKTDYTGRDAFGWAEGKNNLKQLLAAKR